MSCSKSGIYYETTGEGLPVLILHGAMLEHSMMESCLEPVFKNIPGFKRFYVDLPGMGKSPAPEGLSTSDLMLSLLESFIEECIPARKFILIGQSYGAYLARGLLKSYSKRVAGLFLFCPVIEPKKEKRHVPDHQILEISSDLKVAEELKELYSGMFVLQTPYTWERFLSEIHTGIQKTDMVFLKNYNQKAMNFLFLCRIKNRLLISPHYSSSADRTPVWDIRTLWN